MCCICIVPINSESNVHCTGETSRLEVMISVSVSTLLKTIVRVGFIFWVSDTQPHAKNKKLGDAGMEKMNFRPRNRSTDVMANCAPTRQKLRGTGKSHPKIKCLQTIFVLAKYSILI